MRLSVSCYLDSFKRPGSVTKNPNEAEVIDFSSR